jgi:hypothetical protein
MLSPLAVSGELSGFVSAGTAASHDARLMPAKYVRPYSKGQKNDFRDGSNCRLFDQLVRSLQ